LMLAAVILVYEVFQLFTTGRIKREEKKNWK
jgi:hypothetical protein